MAFATTGRSDLRRRRVLMQSNGTPETPPESPSHSRGSSEAGERRRYHEAAQRAFQPALTSLVPRRPLMHFLLACAGLAVALFVLDAWVVRLEHPRLLKDLVFLDPAASGSLMDWVIQGLCAVAAVAAGLVYLVRRHRVDDYRGRYRWWLWVAGCCLIASADATTDFSSQLALGAARAWGNTLVIPPAAVFLWPVLAGALLAGILLRELLESKIATTLLLVSGTWALVTAIATADRLPISDPVLVGMAIATGRFLAVWLTTCGLLWYARHVDLAAHGLLPAAPATRAAPRTAGAHASRESAPSEDPSSAGSKKTRKKKAASGRTAGAEPEPPARTRPASKARKPAEKIPASVSQDAVEPEEGSEDEYRGLSKSERRRLRKQKRRAARRQAA